MHTSFSFRSKVFNATVFFSDFAPSVEKPQIYELFAKYGGFKRVREHHGKVSLKFTSFVL